MTSKRNIGLDLFRIVMMFGICLIHASAQGEYRSARLANIASPSVVGFAMISGYFGLRFAPSKLIRLYALAIGYSFLTPLFSFDFSTGGGYMHSVIEAWGAPWRYWYLHSYAALLCLSPALSKDELGFRQPFVLMVFIWGYLLNYRTVASIIPRIDGFGSHTFVTLLGIYLITRIAKENNYFDKPTSKGLIGVGLMSLLVLYFVSASGSYNSPVSYALIFSLFVIFKRIQSLGQVDRIIRLVAPSMFGVYLLHCSLSFPGFSTEYYGLINDIKELFVNIIGSNIAACILAAFVVFAISLAIDLLRRAILAPVKWRIDGMCNAFDKVWERRLKS